MNLPLTGKTALVTGAGRRLGRATALALAGAGADVVLHYQKSASDAESAREEIARGERKAWTLSADLASKSGPAALIRHAFRLAGTLDILINSASIFPSGSFADLTAEELQQSIQVNAWAPFLLARHFAGKASGGHIVNFLDTRIAGYDWDHAAYGASKHLLAYFTRVMALQFAPRFAVNAVAPGLILPPEGKDARYLDSLKGQTLLKKVGSAREVTDAVLFLVCSQFITGQIIFLDGGSHLNSPS